MMATVVFCRLLVHFLIEHAQCGCQSWKMLFSFRSPLLEPLGIPKSRLCLFQNSVEKTYSLSLRCHSRQDHVDVEYRHCPHKEVSWWLSWLSWGHAPGPSNLSHTEDSHCFPPAHTPPITSCLSHHQAVYRKWRLSQRSPRLVWEMRCVVGDGGRLRDQIIEGLSTRLCR